MAAPTIPQSVIDALNQAEADQAVATSAAATVTTDQTTLATDQAALATANATAAASTKAAIAAVYTALGLTPPAGIMAALPESGLFTGGVPWALILKLLKALLDTAGTVAAPAPAGQKAAPKK